LLQALHLSVEPEGRRKTCNDWCGRMKGRFNARGPPSFSGLPFVAIRTSARRVRRRSPRPVRHAGAASRRRATPRWPARKKAAGCTGGPTCVPRPASRIGQRDQPASAGTFGWSARSLRAL